MYAAAGFRAHPRLTFRRAKPKLIPMLQVGLFVRLEAKPGRESDVEHFLRSSLAIVEEEPDTKAWFAIRIGPSTYAIFDAFEGEKGRQAHLSGRVAAALAVKAEDLLAIPPVIEKVDVLASKIT
jgi:quinol monooxygenase YgiN